MSAGGDEGGGPSRGMSWALVLAGAGLSAVTFAARAGHLPRWVSAEWPAYVVGGVMMLFGVKGLAWRPPAQPTPETGPVRESGLDDFDVAEAEAMDVEARARVRSATPPARAGH
jgi:hypothetical protein